MTQKTVRSLRAVRDARRRYFEEGLLDSGVRPEITASWERSRLTCAPGEGRFRYERDLDLDSRLCRAARPVLGRLSDKLAGTNTSIFLANDRAVIVDRWVDTPELARHLDRVNSVPGVVLDEESVGTNGIGSVLVGGESLLVAGPEHWADEYQPLACAGAAVRNAVTNRVEGVITLSCSARDRHPVALSLVREAAADIEHELLASATERERALLDAFLTATRRSNRPIMSISQGMVITTPAAARILERIDQARLWERVAAAERSARSDAMTFSAGGDEISAVLKPRSTDHARRCGVIVEFEDHSPAPSRQRGTSESRQLPGLVGHSSAWRQAVRQISGALANRRRIVIAGEPGTGKLAVVRCVVGLRSDAQPRVIDAALEAVDGLSAWASELRSALGDPDKTVVLRHMELLSAAGSKAVASLLDAIEEQRSAQVVVTTSMPIDDLPEPLASIVRRCGSVAIEVPPLRSHSDDIQELVARFSGGKRRWTSAALQVLLRFHWPENIRQLKHLVEAVCDAGSTADVGVAELPPAMRCHGTGRTMSKIEEIELTAVLTALSRTQGNKSAAAQLLGVSRSTVYRKLASCGTDLERFAY